MYGLYRLGARLYKYAATLAALAGQKARWRAEGARDVLDKLPATPPHQVCYWMHCASVGEFEQGRPLWEAMRSQNPGARYVLSFFSPSGYRQFHKAQNLGEVIYLPWDVGDNAGQFVDRLWPAESHTESGLAIFAKYEWWLGYHRALSSRKVPRVVISAAFRQNQPFFKSWGAPWREALRGCKQIFVQSQASLALLQNIGVQHVAVVGDTRYDRTLQIRELPLDQPALKAWCDKQENILVAGSTWSEDMPLLLAALRQVDNLSLIIAPHEVGETNLQAVQHALADFDSWRLSNLTDDVKSRVILVDSIGLLSKLYRLGTCAYVGGGFGANIHNTLEPAVYGLPIAFGPKHHRFIEAQELLNAGIATEVKDPDGFVSWVQSTQPATYRQQVLAKAEALVRSNAGATARIMSYLRRESLI